MEKEATQVTYLSSDNLEVVKKETKKNFISNSFYGLLAGIAMYGITRRKMPALFAFSYFMGKSLAESNVLLEAKLQKVTNATVLTHNSNDIKI